MTVNEERGRADSRPSLPDATAAGLPTRQPWHGRPATREGLAGWLFVAPIVIVFLVFFVFPILMSLWVSLLDWNGQSNPFIEFDFVGLDNYRRLLTEDTLLREDFAISVRNTLYYVLVFVPGATALASSSPWWSTTAALKGRGSSARPSTSPRSPARWRSASRSCSCS